MCPCCHIVTNPATVPNCNQINYFSSEGTPMTLAITGASGQLGRLTADALLRRADASDVALISRDPSRLAEYGERGVQLRAGDFTDASSLEQAFAGIDRLLIIST